MERGEKTEHFKFILLLLIGYLRPKLPIVNFRWPLFVGCQWPMLAGIRCGRRIFPSLTTFLEDQNLTGAELLHAFE